MLWETRLTLWWWWCGRRWWWSCLFLLANDVDDNVVDLDDVLQLLPMMLLLLLMMMKLMTTMWRWFAQHLTFTNLHTDTQVNVWWDKYKTDKNRKHLVTITWAVWDTVWGKFFMRFFYYFYLLFFNLLSFLINIWFSKQINFVEGHKMEHFYISN